MLHPFLDTRSAAHRRCPECLSKATTILNTQAGADVILALWACLCGEVFTSSITLEPVKA